MKLRALLLAVLCAAPAAASAGEAVNSMHPLFVPRDAAGRPAKSGSEVSAETTCRGCHDLDYIASHNGHGSGPAAATCIGCHVEGGAFTFSPEKLDQEGRIPREAMHIGPPRPANCASCHGLIIDGQAPLALPPDFESSTLSRRTWSLTQAEGAVVSPQRMRDSFLGLAGKSALTGPWDVHAAKLVECASCHHAANDPALRGDGHEGHRALGYVKVDPRRPSVAELLARPDHRLAEPGCRSCHDALAAHEFLPYRERHVEVIACQTCHIPAPMGPVVEMIDGTVVSPSGGPVVRYRNVERRPGEPLNAATIKPFTPLLVARVESDGARRLSPVNLVSRYRWVAGPKREAVPSEALAAAFLDQGRYAPAVVAQLDQNRDGQIDLGELRLDSEAKAALISGRLRAAGFADPAIEGTLTAHPLAHGVSGRDRALRDCDACHARSSRLSEPFPVVPYLPGGVSPRPDDKARVPLAGVIAPDTKGGLVYQRDRDVAPAGLHVLGASRHGWSNTVGFFLFVAVALGVSAHGLIRFATRRRHAHHEAPAGVEKIRVFSLYERIWHWTMALTGIVLIVTGLEIHNAGVGWLSGLPQMVLVHNVVAVVFTVNAFLSLFYHLATIAIRHLIPKPEGLLRRIMEHIQYQSRGIFVGAAHPVEAPDEKLNPLQQLTYLALLNILFPAQIISGSLIWAVGRWPSFAAAVGGLGVVAPLHNLGAWLFLTFFVLHVYLVTTGRTLGDHLGTMITGYRDAEPGEPS